MTFWKALLWIGSTVVADRLYLKYRDRLPARIEIKIVSSKKNSTRKKRQ